MSIITIVITTIVVSTAALPRILAGRAGSGRGALSPHSRPVALHSAVPSAYGSPVTWQQKGWLSNSGPRFHGGASVLKSALQKNVRLGRAASAVRQAAPLCVGLCSTWARPAPVRARRLLQCAHVCLITVWTMSAVLPAAADLLTRWPNLSR